MTCSRCHGTCQVPVHHNGVSTLDACPACARRAETKYQALMLGMVWGLPMVARRDEDAAVKVAAG